MNLQFRPFGLRGFMCAGDAPLAGVVDRECCWSSCTRNFLTFANATVIAYGQKTGQSLRILVAVFAKVRKLRVEMARRGPVLWAVPRHASQTLGGARAEEFVDEMDCR